MLMETTFGEIMLPNELLLLKVVVGVGFLGWMMLMFTQVVLLDSFPKKEISNFQKYLMKKGKYRNYKFRKAA
jgi:hypothetical protein